MELPGGLGIFEAEQSILDTRSENSRLIPPPVEEVDIFHQASRRGEHDGVIVWISCTKERYFSISPQYIRNGARLSTQLRKKPDRDLLTAQEYIDLENSDRADFLQRHPDVEVYLGYWYPEATLGSIADDVAIQRDGRDPLIEIFDYDLWNMHLTAEEAPTPRFAPPTYRDPLPTEPPRLGLPRLG